MSSTAIGVSLSMSSRIRRGGGGEVDVERVLVTASPTTLKLNQTRRVVAGRFLGMKKRFHGTVAITKAEVDDGEEKMTSRNMRVGLICGGPSAERGISLNSVRSVLDHIQVLEII